MKRFAVIAALHPKIDAETDLTTQACSSCGTQVVSNLEAPHCILCGSDSFDAVEESAADSDIHVTESEMTAIHCSVCESYNILSTVEVSSLGSSFHCTTCGAGLSVVQSSDEEDFEASELAIDEAEKDNGDEEEDSEGEDCKDKGESALDGIALKDPAVALAPEQAPVDMDKQDAGRTESYDAQGAGPQLDDKDQIDAQEMQRQEPYDAPSTSPQPHRIDAGTDNIEVDVKAMKAYINLSHVYADTEISLLTTGEVIHLVSGSSVIVASLTQATAGEHADIFHESRFLDAIDAVLEKDGLAVAISSFHFTPAIVTVDAPSLVRDMVKAEVSAASAVLTSTVEEYDADMLQSLSIAASGINKGFFADLSNDLVSGLVAELSAHVAADTAEAIVASAFADHADSYNKTLLVKARALSAMPVEVRNALSEAISNTAHGVRRAVNVGIRLEQSAVPTKIETSGVGHKPRLVSSLTSALYTEAKAKGGLFGKKSAS